MTRPIFRDPERQRRYDELGYEVLPPIPGDVVERVRRSYESSLFEDHYQSGHVISLYNGALSDRRRVHELLVSETFPFLEAHLIDREPYLSTFLVKEPGSLPIAPHQDWSHTDETEHDSVMCWIPLVDTDRHNGALGFVNGSHRFFDYLRAFPYQTAPTPDFLYCQELVPYLTIVPMRAGEVVVFNNRTIHGSMRNMSDELRPAFTFSLHPKDRPLVFHYLKPNRRLDTLLRYEVTSDFYLANPNPRTAEIYHRGDLISDLPAEELPYELPAISWEAFRKKLEAAGNLPDPWLAAQAKKTAEAGPSGQA